MNNQEISDINDSLNYIEDRIKKLNDRKNELEQELYEKENLEFINSIENFKILCLDEDYVLKIVDEDYNETRLFKVNEFNIDHKFNNFLLTLTGCSITIRNNKYVKYIDYNDSYTVSYDKAWVTNKLDDILFVNSSIFNELKLKFDKLNEEIDEV